MKPTDEERREVAARLRAQVKRLGPHMDAHEFAHYCADVIDRENALRWDQMTLHLADLIEPEERTCRAGVFPDGAGAYVICCTECGYAIGGTWSDLDTARRIARAQHKFTNFCPNCGARVIQE